MMAESAAFFLRLRSSCLSAGRSRPRDGRQTFSSGNGHDRSKRPTIVPFPEDRLPPQSIEAEQGVLGAILLDNDVLHDVVPILKADDFWRDDHQIIFRAIRDLYDAGKPVDAIILADELTRREEFGARRRRRRAQGARSIACRTPPTPSITRRSSARRPSCGADRQAARDHRAGLLEHRHGRDPARRSPRSGSSRSPRSR